MKKVLVVLASSLMFMLVGCSGGNGAADTVKSMYKAAMDRDAETFAPIVSQMDGFEGHEQEAMEEVAEMGFDAGGIEKMKIAEVKKDQLQSEVRDALNEEYGEDWSFVAAELGEESSEVFVWIMKEVDGKHYAVDADDLSPDEFLKK